MAVLRFGSKCSHTKMYAALFRQPAPCHEPLPTFLRSGSIVLIQEDVMADLADDLMIKPSVPIRQKVYDFLRNEILSNHIAAGERLVEGRLAVEIHVSRTPIREALHILEMEGLIESLPRVGYRVKEM